MSLQSLPAMTDRAEGRPGNGHAGFGEATETGCPFPVHDNPQKLRDNHSYHRDTHRHRMGDAGLRSEDEDGPKALKPQAGSTTLTERK